MFGRRPHHPIAMRGMVEYINTSGAGEEVEGFEASIVWWATNISGVGEKVGELDKKIRVAFTQNCYFEGSVWIVF